MIRGAIWTAAGGGTFTSKLRPVLVVQDARFAETMSITVCPSTGAGARLARVRVEPTVENGLLSTSWIMADKVTTIPRVNIGRSIGRLSVSHLLHVDEALVLFLGLAR